MNILTAFYILNAVILILHEIESAYWEEWKILKLPGKISGFVIFNLPLILILFWGLYEIDRGSVAGNIIGIISGIAGLLPFLIHKALVRRKKSFNLAVSNFLIFSNIVTGLVTIYLSSRLYI